MKTKRKLRTRRLALDFGTPPNALPEAKVREGFARMKAELSACFRKGTNDNHDQ